jgi:hypothetical protein
MTLKCIPILRVAFVQELRVAFVQELQSLGWKGKKNTKLGPYDTIRKVLKHRCLKFPRIVYLDLICMSYDKKKG